MRTIIPAALFATLALSGTAFAAETAVATLAGPDGAQMGTVTLTQGPSGVLVSADLHGLAPGGHGFHIHEAGTCTPDFAAAGGHFNPGGSGHGMLDAGGQHAGDMPNLFAAADGSARADFFVSGVTLAADAPNSLFGTNGTSIIVHEKPDTYGADAGAGGRAACGVITRN